MSSPSTSAIGVAHRVSGFTYAIRNIVAEAKKVEATLQRYRKLADLYCTGCKYCMPCPHGVNIPLAFDALNQDRGYGLAVLAGRRYNWPDNRPSLCIACGQCMSKCPQHIDIVAQLRESIRLTIGSSH